MGKGLPFGWCLAKQHLETFQRKCSGILPAAILQPGQQELSGRRIHLLGSFQPASHFDDHLAGNGLYWILPALSQPGQPSGDCLGVELMGISQSRQTSGNPLTSVVGGGVDLLIIPQLGTPAMLWAVIHISIVKFRRLYNWARNIMPWSLFTV